MPVSLTEAKKAAQDLATHTDEAIRAPGEVLAAFVAESSDPTRVVESLEALASAQHRLELQLAEDRAARTAGVEVARRWATPALVLLLIIAQALGVDVSAVSELLPSPAAAAHAEVIDAAP